MKIKKSLGWIMLAVVASLLNPFVMIAIESGDIVKIITTFSLTLLITLAVGIAVYWVLED